MSVRLSQLLVALVLLMAAVALYRTASAYQEQAMVGEMRMKDAAIADRETRRLGDRVAAIEGLAATTALEGQSFSLHGFASAARALMRDDPSVLVIDYFSADDVHLAHIEAGGPGRLGRPPRKPISIPRADVRAVEVALFDSRVSRATSVSDVPPSASSASPQPGEPDLSKAHFYVATGLIAHGQSGTIVELVDARRLLLDDIKSQLPGDFALDDGRGRNLVSASLVGGAKGETLSFPIPFADRVLRLSIDVPRRQEANPWLFALGWLALVLAIVLPMEVVGHINRRVQALNEELESRVTERTHELEQSLKESRRLAAVVESVHEGVMAINGSGVIIYANDALCGELRCSVDDLLGKPIDAIRCLALPQQQLADITAAISETGFVYREMERTRADGTSYVAGVTFTRHGLEGKSSLIAVSRDVTDRRRLVDELLEAKGKLETQTRSRADFIATASHELRTPVTTLRTLSALLLEKLGSRENIAPDDGKLLDILDHESRRLAHLVDDLLKIAKIDALEAALADEPVDLRSVVSAEADELVQFAQQGPQLDLRLAPGPVVVRGDEEALRSVVHNIVSNARKFTPHNGRVEVVVEPDDHHARLRVSDTGAGIAAADLPHIFERFYRGPVTASQAPGAGLGLAIVARLVELMHGSISVASEVGKGTTITVKFPLANVAPRATSEKAASVDG